MSESIQQVGNAVIIAITDERTDARLLECFLATHDEIAFETLVRRHGPMVLGVCNRILQHRQDAEDAFQATFLVLVRKADSIRPRGMVGNWLYGVAYQTARKAQAMTARRRSKERQVMDTPETSTADADEALWRELRPIIDAELNRLPTKYRAPLVLCDIEEKSYKEAAELLGWPEGTVAGRLSRARAMLAKRLSRLGVVLPAITLPLLLTQHATAASVPVALTVPTVKAAALVAAGQATAGAVSANVVALTEGVIKAMMLTKLKIATAIVLGACLTVSGVGMLAPAPAAAQNQKKAASAQPPGKQVDPKVPPKVAPNGNGGNNEQNGNNNQNGNNEKNGNNNQNGNNERNGNNNQNGNNEKNGNNNQNGNNQNGQNGGGNGLGALKLGNGNAPVKVGNNGNGKNGNVPLKKGQNGNGQNGNGQKNQKNG